MYMICRHIRTNGPRCGSPAHKGNPLPAPPAPALNDLVTPLPLPLPLPPTPYPLPGVRVKCQELEAGLLGPLFPWSLGPSFPCSLVPSLPCSLGPCLTLPGWEPGKGFRPRFSDH